MFSLPPPLSWQSEISDCEGISYWGFYISIEKTERYSCCSSFTVAITHGVHRSTLEVSGRLILQLIRQRMDLKAVQSVKRDKKTGRHERHAGHCHKLWPGKIANTLFAHKLFTSCIRTINQQFIFIWYKINMFVEGKGKPDCPLGDLRRAFHLNGLIHDLWSG